MGDSADFRNLHNYKTTTQRYSIEGETVTTLDIAERLSTPEKKVAREVAATRLRKAQRLDGPVTWAKLGVR